MRHQIPKAHSLNVACVCYWYAIQTEALRVLHKTRYEWRNHELQPLKITAQMLENSGVYEVGLTDDVVSVYGEVILISRTPQYDLWLVRHKEDTV